MIVNQNFFIKDVLEKHGAIKLLSEEELAYISKESIQKTIVALAK
jgi:hypothetical protein